MRQEVDVHNYKNSQEIKETIVFMTIATERWSLEDASFLFCAVYINITIILVDLCWYSEVSFLLAR